jgi:flagellar export protein FliJ
MKRFVFRLETVLRHREIVSELREQEFAQAHGRYEVAQKRFEDLETHHRETVAKRPGADGVSSFNAAAIQSREKYLEALSAQILQQYERVEVARMIADEKRAQMVSARQAKEAVVKLRDKDLAAHQAEVEHKTQEALDEIASVRFQRQQMAEMELRLEWERSRAARASQNAIDRDTEPDGRKAA